VTPADDRLLRQLRRGDEAAFRELYRLHTPRLFAVTKRLLSESTDAEDAVQEAWLRAVRGLGTFRQESSFATWLTGIGIRCALEILRKRSPLVIEPLEPSIETVPHLTVDLERAIAELPAGYRAVLVLHDVEGRTHEEIGTLLDIEPGTSKSQLFHARRTLRARLGPVAEGVGK
jgi:RNA polymerase sigma-70 factor (ECF subfamily)